MRSNLRNGINLGFDAGLYRHRLLWSATLGSLAFCSGTIAGVSAGEASIATLQDAAGALFAARMDEHLTEPGLLEVLKNVDVKLFVQQMLQHAGSNLNEVFDVFAQYAPNGGDGFASSLTDNPAAQLANDLIRETDEKMEWLSPLLKTAALGGTVFAAAYVLSRASTAFKAWFVTTSEEYFQKRKDLLVSGQAVKSDILETRERAVTAYARLIAFERRGGQAVLESADLDLARLTLAEMPLGEVLKTLETRMEEIRTARLKEAERAIYAGEDPATVGPVRMRDLVREVVMSRSQNVVDPFVPPPSVGGPGPA